MTSTRRKLSGGALVIGAGLFAAVATMPAWAQQKVPLSNGIPVAPTGLADQPLPDGPFIYKTGETQDVRVTVFTRGLEYPYSMAFLPTGELLVTERPGRLRIILQRQARSEAHFWRACVEVCRQVRRDRRRARLR